MPARMHLKSINNRNRLKREDRRDLVTGYFLGGMKHREIVAVLKERHGITTERATVSRDIQARIKAANEKDPNIRKYRQQQSDQVLTLIAKLWPVAMWDGHKEQYRAIKALNPLFERFARLWGLDSPVRISNEDSEGNPVPLVDVKAIINRFEQVTNEHVVTPTGG